MPIQINPTELRQLLETNSESIQLIDVREPNEYQVFHIDGQLVPLGHIQEFLSEIDFNRPVIIYCKAGIRSLRAAEFLEENGVKNVYNLTGGILAIHHGANY